MKILQEISRAIWELEALRCKRENIIIAFSPLVQYFIEEEVRDNPFISFRIGTLTTFEGVKIYNLHPYNEIVVYDSLNNCYFPELTIKIEVNKKQQHDLPPDNSVNK